MNAALEDAAFSPDEIDVCLLVGGSTRIPWVRTWLENYFGKVPDDSLNPDEAVAYGATIMAGVLAPGYVPPVDQEGGANMEDEADDQGAGGQQQPAA